MAEVFSAYRIYINGELAGEVGDPDEKTYMDRVMNRVFTFQGSGVVEIVIAVADKSHIRSGIQAIPVLGSPVRVSIQRGLRVLYLYHVWDSYGTCQNQDKRICYF